MENKVKALAEFLKVDQETIKNVYDNVFESSDEAGEYLVVTEEERDEAVTEYIKESVWAFNSSFLANETDLPEEAFAALSEKCESGNEGILKMIEATCGLEEFVQSAVDADGHGHFLAGYDHDENEEQINGEWYYIYRTN